METRKKEFFLSHASIVDKDRDYFYAFNYVILRSELIKIISLLIPDKTILTCDGIAAGGSILIAGSHSPGGNTVTASKNSSIPAKR